MVYLCLTLYSSIYLTMERFFSLPSPPSLPKVKLALSSLGTSISQTNKQNLDDILLAYRVVFKSYVKIRAIHGYIHT